MRYKHKPTEIEAVPLTGEEEALALVKRNGSVSYYSHDGMRSYLHIRSTEELVHVGYWLVIDGDDILCVSDDDFRRNYEPV